ncbi:MAG: DUF1727 domain-containing protein [Atopobiaceae bacterium]|nr:DUF1727 domain-containing protein [Atopobiaceae bacterium]
MDARGGIAQGIGRLVEWGLHDLLHRGASQLPGRVALAIDPHLIEHLKSKATRGSIVICGTNGKTTTTGILASALEEAGMTVLCNRAGANMEAGVAAALLHGDSADWAVLENDELSTLPILPQLQPRYLVLLNLFRDQLDRAGEIDHVQDVLVEALASSPGTTLVVCGDDPLSMGVAIRAKEAGTEVLSFGIDEDLGLVPDRVPEARFCQVCGAELAYRYRHYAQLGCFECPDCAFARPELDFRATDVHVDRSGVSFGFVETGEGEARWDGRRIQAGFGGAYMVYNLLAAAALAGLAGVDAATFQRALDSYDPENGRLQSFSVGGREVILNLAKNPAGFNQNLSLLLADEREKAVHIVINDDYNDGRDISWIWEVDFERLLDGSGEPHVIAGGHRANDVQVRLKYAGIAAGISGSVADALSSVSHLPAEIPLYVLTNYSALQPAKEELERIGGQHG